MDDRVSARRRRRGACAHGPAYLAVWVVTQLGGRGFILIAPGRAGRLAGGGGGAPSCRCCACCSALALLTGVVYALQVRHGAHGAGVPRVVLPPRRHVVPLGARGQRRADVGRGALAGGRVPAAAAGAADFWWLSLVGARRAGVAMVALQLSLGHATRSPAPPSASCCWAWFTHWMQWFCHAGCVPEPAASPRSGRAPPRAAPVGAPPPAATRAAAPSPSLVGVPGIAAAGCRPRPWPPPAAGTPPRRAAAARCARSPIPGCRRSPGWSWPATSCSR